MNPDIDILRRISLAEFGPTLRDREICGKICFEGEEAERVARRHRLAARTARNIARATLKQLAREQDRWDRMSVEELLDEETRLRQLQREVQAAWRASGEPTTSTKIVESRRGVSETTTPLPGRADVRFAEIWVRVMATMRAVELQLDDRIKIQEEAEARRRRCEVRTVPARTGRRKSMSGRRLRVPQFVRARLVRGSAVAFWPAYGWMRELETGLSRVGIPPPGP